MCGRGAWRLSATARSGRRACWRKRLSLEQVLYIVEVKDENMCCVPSKAETGTGKRQDGND